MPAALLVRPGRVDDDALAGVVTFLDLGRACELELDRPHPHRDLALVLLVAEVFGELGTGQAGRDLRDVVEEVPHLVDGLRHVEVGLDQHRASLANDVRQPSAAEVVGDSLTLERERIGRDRDGHATHRVDRGLGQRPSRVDVIGGQRP